LVTPIATSRDAEEITMKRMIATLTAVAMAALVSGCATRASGVAPVAISANDYSGIACDEARGKLETAKTQEAALIKKQNNAAAADAVSVFFVLVPLGSVFGADVEGELAQAKGEVLALERYIAASC
jgi:hypothetical protein